MFSVCVQIGDNTATKSNVNNTFQLITLLLPGLALPGPKFSCYYYYYCVGVVRLLLAYSIDVFSRRHHRRGHHSYVFARHNQMRTIYTVIKMKPNRCSRKLIKSLTINSNSKSIIENKSIRILPSLYTYLCVYLFMYINLFKFNRLCFVLFSRAHTFSLSLLFFSFHSYCHRILSLSVLVLSQICSHFHFSNQMNPVFYAVFTLDSLNPLSTNHFTLLHCACICLSTVHLFYIRSITLLSIKMCAPR